MNAFLLFVHILGGIGLFIGGMCELVGLRFLLRAKSVEFLRAATALSRLALVIDPLSSLAVVVTGLYFLTLPTAEAGGCSGYARSDAPR
jgi:hypothetical protein